MKDSSVYKKFRLIAWFIGNLFKKKKNKLSENQILAGASSDSVDFPMGGQIQYKKILTFF